VASTSDDWLGSTDICWQFKAGTAGEPARLSGEVTKRIPNETLAGGGRFVVVASGSTNGKKGEDDRVATLINEALGKITPSKIEVIGSERLTTWCNQHPAIAARWADRPVGLWSLDDWSNSAEHQVPWQASTRVQSEIKARQSDLDFATGSVHQLHIKGPPGVGKTRFALELCREAAWRGAVIYIQQAADHRLIELIDSAVADMGVQLIVVVDEVQSEQLRPLRDSVGRGSGRVRLITIGHSPSPDPTRIPTLLINPLDSSIMQEIIKGLHPAMPPEHVDFVVHFADGYVRLARLAADAIAQNPAMDVRGLLGRGEIHGFLDQMLGTGDRRALYVVAVLTSVGWTDDKQEEGKAIADHFGLDWNSVLATVGDFDRRLGIAPRGGRYRYISPTPLGIHLAVEAWNTYPDNLKSLPDVLPSDEAKDAYYDRLKSITSNPQTRVFAREELAFFFSIDDFLEARAVRRWSALSFADPDEASHNILKALSDASIDDRMQIKDLARRDMVWTLVRLAWRSSSFHNAVKALALLAEAENETWANNASAEFINRFQIFLGGTSVPYLDRLPVLDELLAEESLPLMSLIVKALAKVGNQQAFRAVSSQVSDELPEIEWQPKSSSEHFQCVEAAIIRLSNIAKRGMTEIQADLVTAANDLSMMMRESLVRALVVIYFDAVREAYPETREPLRKVIAGILHRERKHWKKLSAEELEELETLHARFEDSALGARLQQHVGQASWEGEELSDLGALAEELLQAPEVLCERWSWLTSGDAHEAWRLGEALAEVDSEGSLAETMPLFTGGGHDLRLLCGYVNTRRGTLGDGWYDGWFASQSERDPKPFALLFEVTWRCGATESVAHTIAAIIHSDMVSPQIVGQLGYGNWSEGLDVDVLEKVLRAMVDTGYGQTAIGILEYQIRSNSAEAERWKPLALELATASDLIRSGGMASYFWKEVANTLVVDYPGEIAAAILREQADRESGTWFVKHSDAADVLLACVEQDPIGVWQTMQQYLLSPASAYFFRIGFPREVLEYIPSDDVCEWVAEKSEERAVIMSKFTSKNMSTDGTLTSRLIGKYGDSDRVATGFFSDYISGTWTGSSSSHWDQLAEALDNVADRTALPKLRRWAQDSARSLREMEEHDLQREEEEKIRRC